MNPPRSPRRYTLSDGNFQTVPSALLSPIVASERGGFAPGLVP